MCFLFCKANYTKNAKQTVQKEIVLLFRQFDVIGAGSNASDFIEGAQVGLLLAVEFFVFKKGIGYKKALGDAALLQALYIKETDERKALIQKEIGTFSFNIILSVLAISTIVAGYFNLTVFFTLFGTLAFIALTKGFAKVYFNKKY